MIIQSVIVFCVYPVDMFDNSYYGLMSLKVNVGVMRFFFFLLQNIIIVQRPANAAANAKVVTGPAQV